MHSSEHQEEPEPKPSEGRGPSAEGGGPLRGGRPPSMDLLHLQRTAGNRAVSAFVSPARRGSGPAATPIHSTPDPVTIVQRQKRKRDDTPDGPSKRRRVEPSATADTTMGEEEGADVDEVDGNDNDTGGADVTMEPDSGVDEITGMMANLSLSFDDADGERHEIYPDMAAHDLIVESNPVPLKSIIARGRWQAKVLAADVIADLRTNQTLAEKALKVFGKRRRKEESNVLRLIMHTVVALLKKGGGHEIPKTDLTGSTNHNKDNAPVEGIKVVASPLSINSDHPGHKPKDSRLMKAIRDLAGGHSRSYVQMHLLNDNLFGPGQLWNLTPGPKQSNGDMERNIEDPLKRAVLDKGKVLDLVIEVNYNNDPNNATDQQIAKDPTQYLWDKITFRARQWSTNHGSSAYAQKATNTDADVKEIMTGEVRWDYGSLPPLKAKPNILTCTSAADLKAAGVSTPDRWATFNQNNPGYTLKAKDDNGKKKELAGLIEAWEAKTAGTKPKKVAISWTTSRVLWD